MGTDTQVEGALAMIHLAIQQLSILHASRYLREAA